MPPQGAPPTPQNMPPQGADGSYELETVQAFLDNLVEEMHISDDEFNTELFDKDPVCMYKLACTLFISSYNNIATTTLHIYTVWYMYVHVGPLCSENHKINVIGPTELKLWLRRSPFRWNGP